MSPILLLESNDVARAAGLSVNGVILAANSGRLRVYARTRGGRRLYSSSDVDAFVQRRAAKKGGRS